MKRKLTEEQLQHLVYTLIELYVMRRLKVSEMSEIMHYKEKTILIYLSKHHISRSGINSEGNTIKLENFKRLSDNELFTFQTVEEINKKATEEYIQNRSKHKRVPKDESAAKPVEKRKRKAHKEYIELEGNTVIYKGLLCKKMNKADLREAFIRDGILKSKTL